MALMLITSLTHPCLIDSLEIATLRGARASSKCHKEPLHFPKGLLYFSHLFLIYISVTKTLVLIS